MDDITTRTIIIAVNVFVTIAIVSIVIIMFFQMEEIYGVVASTDTSIYNTFDNAYSMYHGRTMTGLGLLNTVKKYEDNTEEKIFIKYPNSNNVKQNAINSNKRESVYLKQLMETSEGFKYETKYNVTVEINEVLGQTTIEFIEI